jgi:hypothetical protein
VNVTIPHGRTERAAIKPIGIPPKVNSTGPAPPPGGPVGFNSTASNLTRSFDDDDMEDEMRR